jgi:chromosome partitioning protein
LAEVEERHGLPVFSPPVPKSVRFAEAPELGCSILQHAPGSAGAAAYRALATQVVDAMKLA